MQEESEMQEEFGVTVDDVAEAYSKIDWSKTDRVVSASPDNWSFNLAREDHLCKSVGFYAVQVKVAACDLIGQIAQAMTSETVGDFRVQRHLIASTMGEVTRRLDDLERAATSGPVEWVRKTGITPLCDEVTLRRG